MPPLFYKAKINIFDFLPAWMQFDYFGIYWKFSGNILGIMVHNTDDFPENQETGRHLDFKVTHCSPSAVWQLWDRCSASEESRWEQNIWFFSLSLLTDGLLMMVEKEGRHQLLAHGFRKARITGYLEEGLKTEAHNILDGEDAEGQGCCSSVLYL